MKRMFEIRTYYPVANDGLFVQTISQLTKDIFLPGSSTTPTVTGLWSVLRGYFPGVQKEATQGNQTLWLVYQNGNTTESYGGNCSNKDVVLLALFESGTRLKNLFYPYEELTLEDVLESGEAMTGSISPLSHLLQLPYSWGFRIARFSPLHEFLPSFFFPLVGIAIASNKMVPTTPMDASAA